MWRQTLLLLHFATWRSLARVTGLETLPAERAERGHMPHMSLWVDHPFHSLASLSLPLSASSILRMPLYACRSTCSVFAARVCRYGGRRVGHGLTCRVSAVFRRRSFQRQTWALKRVQSTKRSLAKACTSTRRIVSRGALCDACDGRWWGERLASGLAGVVYVEVMAWTDSCACVCFTDRIDDR